MKKPTVVVTGNLNADLVCRGVNALPAWGQEKTCGALLCRPAGSAGYAALALGRLGLAPVVIGNVGNDDQGRMILRALSDAGADTGNVEVSRSPTGTSIAMVNDRGERAFVTYCGHLGLLDVDRILHALDSLSDITYILLAGYFLLPSLGSAGARRVLRAGRERGATTLLDTGWDPGGWESEVVQEVRDLLRDVDVFLPNHEEAAAVAGTSELQRAADYLLTLGPQTVIVKRGARGSLFASRSLGVVEQAPFEVPVVDTTGAGDSFNAGVVYALTRGWEPQKVLQFANAVAAITISRSEPRFPGLSEVSGLLRREHSGTWTPPPSTAAD